MIWKECLVISVALCVFCEGRSAFSEVTVKKHYKGHHSEVSKTDHKTTENHEEYAKSHPSYEFSYKVIDPHTHDKKGQQETRDGDKVTGHYWLIQPDGHKRLIKYNVDGKHGFTADVNYALHDEHQKDDSEQDVHEPEHEHKEHEKETDDKGIEKPHEDIKEEIKEEHEDTQHEEPIHIHTHEDKEPEKESEEFESEKIHERKVDEKHDEEDKKEEHKNEHETHIVHEKEEKDNKNEKEKEHIDLWSQIRNWGKLDNDDKDDVWSWPKTYIWGGETEHKEDQKHEEHDNNEGNVWSWRKSYDVWEVKHKGGENKNENDDKDKSIKEEHPIKRPEDDGDKRKGHRRNVGLRDYEYRGQPTYHVPIMKTKPIPYRRRIIVN